MANQFLIKETMADMKALSAAEITALQAGTYDGVQLLGYYEKGDTPASIIYHYVDPLDDPRPEDGGSVIVAGSIKLIHKFIGEVNVRYFGANGLKTQNCFSFINNVFKYALANSVDIYHPSGYYNFFTSNSPYKTLTPAVESLFDCKGITIRGDGDTTVLMTETAGGADVLNLHKVQNLTIRDLAVTGVLTGSSNAGTNGISVISGYDNLQILNVTIFDLYGIQKEGYPQTQNKGSWNAATNTPNLTNTGGGAAGDYYTVSVAGSQNFGGNTTFSFEVGDVVVFVNNVYWKQSYYIDGGKALTIQNGNSPLQLGTIKADIKVKNCGYGFGIDYFNHNFANKKTAIDIHIIAERCHRGISLDGNFDPTIPVSVNKQVGLKIDALTVDCQEDLYLRNLIGGDINVKVNTTLSAEQRRMIPDGSRYWNIQNKKVNAIRAYNAMYTNIAVTGDKGECDSKYEIGGDLVSVNSGYIGSTQFSEFLLNVSGNPSTAFVLVNAGGNFIRNSVLNILSENLDDLPDLLFYSSRGNSIITKSGSYFPYLKSYRLNLTNVDSKANLAELSYLPNKGLTLQQKALSGPTDPIHTSLDFSGNPRFSILNNGTVKVFNTSEAGFAMMSGAVLPEGNVVAEASTIYIRSAKIGGSLIAGSIWFKQSITGNTGWVRIDHGNATTTLKGVVNQAGASMDSAPNPSAAYTQSEAQAMLTELRDLKAQLRSAGILAN